MTWSNYPMTIFLEKYCKSKCMKMEVCMVDTVVSGRLIIEQNFIPYTITHDKFSKTKQKV